MQAYVKAILH